MQNNFSEESYNSMISALFQRFPSFQTTGAGAYKPGIDNMMFFDQLAGHPHRQYRTIHVAGTNGKGSVSNMLASVLASCGMKVGLYTSPHILDFRERMRVAECGVNANYISKEEVWEFWKRWGETADHLDLSFFEITTMMAFDWFAKMKVDIAVIETGLGGRLDSTNIISPELSVITNIGLDHCDMLGDTLAEIAFEKAGIIKPCIPAVIGESNPETDLVFERKVLYSNLSETEFMGDRNRIMSLLTFADKTCPPLWEKSDEILKAMDLQGDYQRKNLRTVLAALDILDKKLLDANLFTVKRSGIKPDIADAIIHTASRMDFHGRWEKLCDSPCILCDIGHNSHGLKYNFFQLEKMMESGEYSDLTIVYGAMTDKDVDAIVKMFPPYARYIFVTAHCKRAMPAERIKEKYIAAGGDGSKAVCCPDVDHAVKASGLEKSPCRSDSASKVRSLVYIGGSTYVVSEAIPVLKGILSDVAVAEK